MSESPPTAAPYRWRFLARNRIIAALSGATVVVEASLRSGSLSTAKEARDHHLPVGAVPGPVTSATSAGCHALVRDTGAVLVTDAAEAAELAAPIGSDLAPVARPRPEPPRGPPRRRGLPRLVRRAGPRVGDDRADRAWPSGVRAESLGAVLAALEADGLVVRDEGRWRKRPRRSVTVGRMWRGWWDRCVRCDVSWPPFGQVRWPLGSGLRKESASCSEVVAEGAAG